VPRLRADAHHVEDESYFVSMTDLMVGMLFIFIILLMAFALNLKDQQTKIDAATDSLTSASEAREKLLKQLEAALKDQGIEVTIDIENGVLRLPESTLFKTGEYRLDIDGQRALKVLAANLQSLLPSYTCVRTSVRPECPEGTAHLETIFIEGHTDDVPVGAQLASKVENNWGLSARRAIEVYTQLVKEQPALDSFESARADERGHKGKLIGVSGYADRRPIDETGTDEGRTKNRRIDLRFIMSTPSRSEVNQIRQSLGTSSSP